MNTFVEKFLKIQIIMNNSIKGILIHTDIFGWQVRYEYGQNQSKCIPIHIDSIQDVENNGIEGEEVFFELKGSPAPSTLNGVVSSARIIK